VQRGDFWGWGQFAPTDGRLIVNRDVRLARADAASAEVEIHNDWMVHNQKVLDEATTAVLRDEANARILDLTYRLTSDWEVTIPQISFSGFCFRCRNDGESYFSDPKGKVTLPDPHFSVIDLDWPASPWYSYTLQSKTGKTIACAVIDHPSNPPSLWHNPRYLWMINPCIAAPKAVVIPRGQALTLRYRTVVNDGPFRHGLLDRLTAEWRPLHKALALSLPGTHPGSVSGFGSMKSRI
jgi:hypothetical protein